MSFYIKLQEIEYMKYFMANECNKRIKEINLHQRKNRETFFFANGLRQKSSNAFSMIPFSIYVIKHTA